MTTTTSVVPINSVIKTDRQTDKHAINFPAPFIFLIFDVVMFYNELFECTYYKIVLIVSELLTPSFKSQKNSQREKFWKSLHQNSEKEKI